MTIKTIKMSEYPVYYMTTVIYGKPGVKKTRFATTWPKPCLIDIDQGLSSARSILPPEYEIKQIETYEDMLALVSMLKQNKEGYQSVVLDSFSLFQRMIMANCLRITGHDKPEINDWQLLRDKSIKIIEWLKALPMHRVFVCLEDTVENKLTGAITCAPMLPGKLANEAPAFVDEVYHMRSENIINPITKKYDTKSTLLTRNDGIYIAKNRGGGLERIEDPDYNTIYRKILDSPKYYDPLEKKYIAISPQLPPKEAIQQGATVIKN